MTVQRPDDDWAKEVRKPARTRGPLGHQGRIQAAILEPMVAMTPARRRVVAPTEAPLLTSATSAPNIDSRCAAPAPTIPAPITTTLTRRHSHRIPDGCGGAMPVSLLTAR